MQPVMCSVLPLPRHDSQSMTNTQFVKLVRTCPGLSHLQVTDLDIIFAKIKSKGERTISFDQVGIVPHSC